MALGEKKGVMCCPILGAVPFSSTALVGARRSLAGDFVLVSRLLLPRLLAAFLDSRAHGSSAVLLLVKPNLLSVLVRLVENRLSAMARLQVSATHLFCPKRVSGFESWLHKPQHWEQHIAHLRRNKQVFFDLIFSMSNVHVPCSVSKIVCNHVSF
ncbi:hypothetical protein Cgig2_022533 [Carnegiea gigantea]|uniref:Uncharacterized protein n=1 Tax=Carnegiea gigantea TaxID=171969 RepID=A0A9Q1JN50_9CARY|nr:hypothetical protein Cgig2_022533 [Carnegiea gigantea]